MDGLVKTGTLSEAQEDTIQCAIQTASKHKGTKGESRVKKVSINMIV